VHTRDINVEEVIVGTEMDDRVARVVNPLALAFERSVDLGATFRALMKEMLKQFLGTHKSIRLLMKNSEENPSGMADAMSLAREQIEKVYVVALLLEEPERWTERYLKDEWRKTYERHLLDIAERSGLERYRDVLKERTDSLEEERKLFGITDEEKEVVEWRYRNPPGTSTPSHIKAASKTIANFPVPKDVILEVSDLQLGDVLRRWQREYGYFSGYSHSGFFKLMPGMMGNMKLTTSEKEKVVETEYHQSIWISYLATGIACTEAATRALPRGSGGSAPATMVAEAELVVKVSDL
jgi:hypothetical protein